MGEGLVKNTCQFISTCNSKHPLLVGDRVRLLLKDGTEIEVIATPSHQGSLVIRAVGTRSRIAVMPELANEIRVLAAVSFPDITKPDSEYLARMKKTQAKSIKRSEKIPNLLTRRAPKNRFTSIIKIGIPKKRKHVGPGKPFWTKDQ